MAQLVQVYFTSFKYFCPLGVYPPKIYAPGVNYIELLELAASQMNSSSDLPDQEQSS